MVSDEKLVVNLIKGPLYKMSYFSHNFQDFLLSSSLDSLIIMCLRVDHFEFILLGSFWMHRFLSFTKFGKIFGIISLNILSVPFSHFPPFGTLPMLVCLMVSHGSVRLSSFSLHSFFCFSNWMVSTDLSSGSLIHSSACSNLLFKKL